MTYKQRLSLTGLAQYKTADETHVLFLCRSPPFTFTSSMYLAINHLTVTMNCSMHNTINHTCVKKHATVLRDIKAK